MPIAAQEPTDPVASDFAAAREEFLVTFAYFETNPSDTRYVLVRALKRLDVALTAAVNSAPGAKARPQHLVDLAGYVNRVVDDGASIAPLRDLARTLTQVEL